MHRLPAALDAAIRDLGGAVRTGVEATAIVPQSGQWLVRAASGMTLRARSVVLAMPLAASAALVERAAPGVFGVVPAATADVRLCTVVLDDPRLDAAPRGTGVLVAAAVQDVRAKALTHATAKWPWLAAAAGPGRHVLRLSYGRAGDSADPAPDADLADTALRDASALLGVPLRADDVVASATVPWPGTLNTFPPGHAEAVRRARATLEPQGTWLVGAGVAGSGLAAVVIRRPRAGARAARRHPLGDRPADGGPPRLSVREDERMTEHPGADRGAGQARPPGRSTRRSGTPRSPCTPADRGPGRARGEGDRRAGRAGRGSRCRPT